MEMNWYGAVPAVSVAKVMASFSFSESEAEPRPCAAFAEFHLWKVFSMNKFAWLSFLLCPAHHGLFKPLISSRGDDDDENHPSLSGQKERNRDEEAKDSCQRQASSSVPEADLDEGGLTLTLTPDPDPGEDTVLQFNPSKLTLAFLLVRMLFSG